MLHFKDLASRRKADGCEVFWCFERENAPEKFYGILKRKSAYAIMPVGKKL